jgi:hypothetical protein
VENVFRKNFFTEHEDKYTGCSSVSIKEIKKHQLKTDVHNNFLWRG